MVLTVTVKARYFPCRFRHKMALVKCPFRLRRLAQNDGRGWRGQHFPCKFLHKMALVTRPCAFRLRRLAQNDGRGRCVQHFPCKFQRKMALMTCPCAFWLRRLAQNDGPGRCVRHFLCKFPHKWFLWHVHVHFDCAGSHETGVAVLVSYILPCTVGLVVCPCALRLLLGSLRRDLAKKHVM